MEWLTASKAFDKSTKTPKVCKLFSKDSWIWFVDCRIACSIEWPDWKPNGFGYRIFLGAHDRIDDYTLSFQDFWKSKEGQKLVCS